MGKGKGTGPGRPKGSVNRFSKALREQMVGTKDDPVNVLKRVISAGLKTDDWELVRKAASDLLPYLHPRLSSHKIDLDALLQGQGALSVKIVRDED